MIIRGPHAEHIKQDLADLYARDRGRGMGWWRAQTRHARRVVESMFHIWRGGRPPRMREGRGGSMLQDFRFALRLFRKHPAPVGIAIGGLALAIGVVASVFTIVDAATLRPYGMDDPSSVVKVTWARHQFSEWPYSTFTKMRQATATRAEASALSRVRFSDAAPPESDATRWMLFVSGGYLQTFGGRPALGRTLEPSDDLPGAPPVVVLSHQFWATRLSGDPAAAGKTIWLNGAPVTVVGVLRADFTGPTRILPAMWAPLSAADEIRGDLPFGPDSTTSVEVTGRLLPGVTAAAAQQEMDGIVKRVFAANGSPLEPRWTVALQRARSPIDQDNQAEAYTGLAILAGILGLVLAVACANTANLLLAAATTRTPEMGLRLALGASPGRLVRQMVSESLLLAVIAGGLGFLFAIWFVPIMSATLAMSMETNATPDMRVLLFTIAVALVCGLSAGLSPARYAARRSVLPALKSQAGADGGGGPSSSRLRTAFVGVQAAASMLLLAGAALLARSALHNATSDVGFDVDRLLVVEMELPKGVTESAYTQAAAEALRQMNGVQQVSLSQNAPFGRYSNERDRFTRGGVTLQLNVMRSDAQFLSTAGLRLLRGRGISVDEAGREAPVALISESVAREFFGDTDPIGQSLSTVVERTKLNGETSTIIGIVGDAMLSPIRSEIAGTIYHPIQRTRSTPPFLIVRTAHPGATMHAVKDALRRVDPRIQSTTIIVREGLDEFLEVNRMLAWLAAPVALLVLLLAVVGVFGVTAFVVSQRMREMSLRVAVGAEASDLRWLLLRDSLPPVVIGLLIGLVAAVVVGQSSMELIGGISPYDPIAIGGAMFVLLMGALAAVIIPARRAGKADPASLLRST